jgi:methylmalonyl-CoA carboxyltransferase small subunit
LKLKITIDKTTYEVEVEAAEPEPAHAAPRGYVVESAPLRVPAAPAPATGAPPGDVNEDKVCRSPISGLVVRISVQAGQSIQAGDILLVLEAMKMETNITAPIAGKIAKINAQAGEGVQAGQVLVEFE